MNTFYNRRDEFCGRCDAVTPHESQVSHSWQIQGLMNQWTTCQTCEYKRPTDWWNRNLDGWYNHDWKTGPYHGV